MKRTVLAVAMFFTAGASVADSPEAYSGIEKEIEIVKGIIDTSLKQQQPDKGLRYRSLDATYLAGQGVVFTVTTSGSSGWANHMSEFISQIPPIPPLPEVPVIVHGGDVDIELSHEWESFAEETAERFEEAFAETSEKIHDLRSDQREIAWERREIERRKRDLEFEASRGDKSRQEEIKNEFKEMEKELASLTKREQKLKTRADAFEQQRSEEIAAREKAQQEALKAFLSSFETGVGDALCRFGGGMRALPAEQHITFVLKSFSRDENRQSQDRIYVFDKRQVNACVQDKISADKLLTEAHIYDF